MMEKWKLLMDQTAEVIKRHDSYGKVRKSDKMLYYYSYKSNTEYVLAFMSHLVQLINRHDLKLIYQWEIAKFKPSFATEVF